MFMINLLLLVLAYVIGMIPNAYILGLFMDKDKLAHVRSDLVGAYKVLINIKKPEFFMTLLLDFLKGALLVSLTLLFETWVFLPMLLILIAMIARNFNVFIGFRNGVGIAILMGGMLIYAPWFILIYLILVLIIAPFINDLDAALAMATIVIPLGSALMIQAVHSVLIGIMIVAVVFVQKIVYTNAAAFRTKYSDYKRGNPFV